MTFDLEQVSISGSDREDDFLLREGLDLLAAYRSINNSDVRRTLLEMIVAVAQAQHDGDMGSTPQW